MADHNRGKTVSGIVEQCCIPIMGCTFTREEAYGIAVGFLSLLARCLRPDRKEWYYGSDLEELEGKKELEP